ncbi:MAG: hypothetical protein JRH20_22115 [Deltaproteobacteria bacterium]|nr:hypothetical protein [Deltaproteobacteria bacterium]
MNQKDLQNQLVDYLYDELDATAKAEFEQALANNEEIRLEVEAFRKTRQVFGQMEEFEVPSAISFSLIQEASRAAPGPAQLGFWARLHAGLRMMVTHPAMGAATVMIAVIGVSFYVYRHGTPPTGGELNRVGEEHGYRPAVATPPTTAAEKPKAVSQSGPIDRAKTEAAKTGIQEERESASNDALAPAITMAAQTHQPNKEGAHRQQQLGGKSVGSTQVKTRDDKFVASPGPALKSGARRRSRGYKYKKTPRARPQAIRGNALDDLGNLASERRKGYATPKQALGVSAPKRLKAKRSVSPNTVVQKSLEKKSPNKKSPSKVASLLVLGRKAAAAGKCSLAFDYFTRALSSDASLAGEVSNSLGRCRARLGGKGPHVWLASRVQQSEKRRKAARRKAKKRAKPKAQTSAF